jgi:hypothetical protein
MKWAPSLLAHGPKKTTFDQIFFTYFFSMHGDFTCWNEESDGEKERRNPKSIVKKKLFRISNQITIIIIIIITFLALLKYVGTSIKSSWIGLCD